MGFRPLPNTDQLPLHSCKEAGLIGYGNGVLDPWNVIYVTCPNGSGSLSLRKSPPQGTRNEEPTRRRLSIEMD